jgi:hypothetical protein
MSIDLGILDSPNLGDPASASEVNITNNITTAPILPIRLINRIANGNATNTRSGAAVSLQNLMLNYVIDNTATGSTPNIVSVYVVRKLKQNSNDSLDLRSVLTQYTYKGNTIIGSSSNLLIDAGTDYEIVHTHNVCLDSTVKCSIKRLNINLGNINSVYPQQENATVPITNALFLYAIGSNNATPTKISYTMRITFTR